MVWIQIYWKLHLVWVSYKFSFYIPQFLPQYSELSLEITSSLPLLNFSIYIKDLKHQQLSLSQGDNIQLLLTHRAVTPLACPTCSAARDQQSCRDKPLIRCHPISIRRISAQCWQLCASTLFLPPLCAVTHSPQAGDGFVLPTLPRETRERNYNRTAWKTFSW